MELPTHKKPLAIPIPANNSNTANRTTHTQNDVLSPVDPSGCFEFDRVIKSGRVLKRTRKTKQWKPVFLVLRPQCLSIYRDEEATKLRHQITLGDITAVARQRDPKRRAQHVFGLFSPARNFHIEARSDEDAQDWVERIRREARIDEDEDEITAVLPSSLPAITRHDSPVRHRNLVSSSSIDNAGHAGMQSASTSDFSDAISRIYGGTARMSKYSKQAPPPTSGAANTTAVATATTSANGPPSTVLNTERVIHHGHLYLHRRKSSRWKTYWAVLRPKALALYKSEDEYAALLVVPLATVLDAVEYDTRRKQHCFQLITDETALRFATKSEGELDHWLGALKSLIVRMRRDSTQNVARIVGGEDENSAGVAAQSVNVMGVSSPNAAIPSITASVPGAGGGGGSKGTTGHGAIK